MACRYVAEDACTCLNPTAVAEGTPARGIGGPSISVAHTGNQPIASQRACGISYRINIDVIWRLLLVTTLPFIPATPLCYILVSTGQGAPAAA